MNTLTQDDRQKARDALSIKFCRACADHIVSAAGRRNINTTALVRFIRTGDTGILTPQEFIGLNDNNWSALNAHTDGSNGSREWLIRSTLAEAFGIEPNQEDNVTTTTEAPTTTPPVSQPPVKQNYWNGMSVEYTGMSGVLDGMNGLPRDVTIPDWLAVGKRVIRETACPKYPNTEQHPWSKQIPVGSPGTVTALDPSDNTAKVLFDVGAINSAVLVDREAWLPYVDLNFLTSDPIPSTESEPVDPEPVDPKDARIAELEKLVADHTATARHRHLAIQRGIYAMNEVANGLADRQNYCSEYEDALDEINQAGARAMTEYAQSQGIPIYVLPDFEHRSKDYTVTGTATVTVTVQVPISTSVSGENSESDAVDYANENESADIDSSEILDAIRYGSWEISEQEEEWSDAEQQ